jgi:ligand-binding sensor domain-containing protein
MLPAEETKGLEVNPGAMLAADGRLYVGTLESGVYALEAATGKWTRIASVLTSANATAFAVDAAYLYVGTEHGITRIERSSLS